MARFALRNQKKIADRLGKVILDLHLKSLKALFDSDKEIEEHTYEGEKFKVIHVPSVHPRSEMFFEFYVLNKRYDVYLLAYKSVVG